MAGKKNTSLDRVLGRLDSLDSANLANLVQRLARERSLFENVFNILQEGVLVIDADGVIDYVNASAHGLIGLSSRTSPPPWKLAAAFTRSGTAAAVHTVKGPPMQ